MPKEINRQFTTYTDAEIQNWLKELQSVPEEIKTTKKQIEELSSQKETKKNELKTVKEDELAPVDNLILKIESQIKTLELPAKIEKLSTGLPPLQEQVKSTKHNWLVATDVKNEIDAEVDELQQLIEIKELKKNIHLSQGKQEKFKKQLDNLQAEARNNSILLVNIKSTLVNLNANIRRLEIEIDEETRRLSQYTSSQTTSSGMQDDGYTSSAQNSGYTSTGQQAQNSGYTSTVSNSQYITSSNMLEMKKRELRNLKQQRSDVNSQANTLDLVRIQLESQISDVDKELTQEQRKKYQWQKKLDSFSREKVILADAQIWDALRHRIVAATKKQKEKQDIYNRLRTDFNNVNDRAIRLETQINDMQHDLDEAFTLRGEFAANTDLDDLHKRLSEEYLLQAQIIQKKKKIEASIVTLGDDIRAQEWHVKNLETKHSELKSNAYFNEINFQAELKFKQFVKLINAQIKDFELDHPMSQSPKTRLAIAEIKNKMAFIEKFPSFNQSNYQSYLDSYKNEDYKIRYTRLCGLLWDQLNSLDEKTDYEFANCLVSLLKKHPRAEKDTVQKYNELNLPNLSPAEFESYEKNSYHEAVDLFKKNIAKIATEKGPAEQNLHAAMDLLLNKIEQKKLESTFKNNFDYKYYTSVLQTANLLAYKPHDLDLQRSFQSLMQHADDGKPSLGLKILGAGMVFLGAIVTVGSIFVGLSFVPKTFAPLIGGLSAGASLITAGIGCIIGGQSHGLHNKMNHYYSAAKNSTFFSSLPSAPPMEPTPEPQPVVEEKQDRLYPLLTPSQ